MTSCPAASLANFEIDGDPTAHSVSLTMGSKVIVLTF